jgi:hypothetical protein
MDGTERRALIFSVDFGPCTGLTHNHKNGRIWRDLNPFKSVLRGPTITILKTLNARIVDRPLAPSNIRHLTRIMSTAQREELLYSALTWVRVPV